MTQPATRPDPRQLIVEPNAARLPTLIIEAGEDAQKKFIEFFIAGIRNPNTRQAYLRAVGGFMEWCDDHLHGLALKQIEPSHIGVWVEWMNREGLSKATIKQRMSAVSRLFNWLWVGGIVSLNPVAPVQRPKEVVRKIKTYVPVQEEAHRIIEAIDTSTLAGLRDRALIGTLGYTFSRVSAAIGMKVEDYSPRGKRWRLRFDTKGGKVHDVPAHHKLEEWLDDYLQKTGLKEKPQHPMFPSVSRKTKLLTDRPLLRQEVYKMIRHRARKAGITQVKVGCHSFRGYGITSFRTNGGTLDKAQQIAGHADPSTTDMYDVSEDEITLTEIERVML